MYDDALIWVRGDLVHVEHGLWIKILVSFLAMVRVSESYRENKLANCTAFHPIFRASRVRDDGRHFQFSDAFIPISRVICLWIKLSRVVSPVIYCSTHLLIPRIRRRPLVRHSMPPLGSPSSQLRVIEWGMAGDSVPKDSRLCLPSNPPLVTSVSWLPFIYMPYSPAH